jgi:very-short-patch-repair endonuclease
MPRSTDKATVAKARRLRREMTLPEVLIWRLLQDRPEGLKFRRQHPVGPYVLDFYAPAARLAIEIDGIVHAMGDRPERDAIRDEFLEQRRIGVVRIAADEVLRSVEEAAVAIVGACRAVTKAPPPR